MRRLGFVQRLYERAVLTQGFKESFGRPPNLRNPATFNEKVTYKMLYDRRPILPRITDKVRARDYAAERIGAEYLTELYQVCQAADEIDWQALPQRFVIKANHGSGMNIFVLDKSAIDVDAVTSRLDAWLARNRYADFVEWAYRDVKPAILVEEMLTENDGAMAANWKFFTFDGHAEFLRVDLRWLGKPAINNYDRCLHRLDLSGKYQPKAPIDPKFPPNIELMFSLADKLGGGLDFVRVDLYNVNGRIVFGELTNYPGAGRDPFYPAEFDAIFGSKWRLPKRYA